MISVFSRLMMLEQVGIQFKSRTVTRICTIARLHNHHLQPCYMPRDAAWCMACLEKAKLPCTCILWSLASEQSTSENWCNSCFQAVDIPRIEHRTPAWTRHNCAEAVKTRQVAPTWTISEMTVVMGISYWFAHRGEQQVNPSSAIRSPLRLEVQASIRRAPDRYFHGSI
jgi:hypothetical protein